MPNLNFTSSFKKNSGLVLSAKEIRESYLYGITLNHDVFGSLSDETIEFYIRDAQQQLENYLNLKLQKQIFQDNLHFVSDDWRSWGYINTTYPVQLPLSLDGFLNTTKQVTYPREWLTSKKNGDEKLAHRSIYIVPAGNTSSVSSSVIFAGIIPQLGYLGSRTIPYYWTANYVTGFDVIPGDILNAIGKFTAISLLLIAGDQILGKAGVHSTSLSIDGLSQGLTSSPSAYSTRIKLYQDDLTQRLLPLMKGTYTGIIFGVC